MKQRAEELIEREDWNEALALCRQLCRKVPNSIFGYISLSLCLHELGKTVEAKNVLLAGPSFLKDSPLYHYNLACYEAQLGNFEKAKQSLRLSFEMNEGYRELAKTDPDLADFPIHLVEPSDREVIIRRSVCFHGSQKGGVFSLQGSLKRGTHPVRSDKPDY